MENKKSLLTVTSIQITPNINIKIPSVLDVLNDEKGYFDKLQLLISSPYSCMVELDDLGIDFSEIDEFKLFLIHYYIIFSNDLSVWFGNTFSNIYEILNSKDLSVDEKRQWIYPVEKIENGLICLYDKADDILIDEFIYSKIADSLREIHCLKKDTRKAGNGAAKTYLIDKNRRWIKRHKNDKYKYEFENRVIALVNRPEFKYNYEETLDLSLYKFNKSVEQISHSIAFDKLMIGVYAGTVDTSKMSDKSKLNFIKE